VFGGDGGAEKRRIQLESRLRDRPCYCGRLNCSEAFLSGPGLEATHAELWGETRSAAHIARRGDARSEATWDGYRHMLARSLAQIVNVFDPGVIVLGGGVSNATALYGTLEALIPAFAFTSMQGADGAPVNDVRVTVLPARWGDDSGVRGAARLWDGASTH